MYTQHRYNTLISCYTRRRRYISRGYSQTEKETTKRKRVAEINDVSSQPTKAKKNSVFNYRSKCHSKHYRLKGEPYDVDLLTKSGYEQLLLSELKPLDVKTPLPPQLQHGLNEVLFKPGVHLLKDWEDTEYYFPKWLSNIHQPEEINYDAITGFSPPSQDKNLHKIAQENECQFVASTSSVTSLLSQIYFLFSRNKTNNMSSLPTFSKINNKSKGRSFTAFAMKPAFVEVRSVGDNIYALDGVNKPSKENILLDLGHSLEHFLTTTKQEFEETALKSGTNLKGEKNEAFAYAKTGNLLIRSQLDCYHPKLQSKTFDVKTRATHNIRYNLSNYRQNAAKLMKSVTGTYNSFEREFYDMIRNAFLKYIFQARIGGMDGIFVAYHNTQTLFGFEYFQLKVMENCIFETKKMADVSCNTGYTLLGKLLNKIESYYDGTSTLRILIGSHDYVEDPKLMVFVLEIPKDKDVGWIDNNKTESGSKVDVAQKYPLRGFELRVETVIDEIHTTGSFVIEDDSDVTIWYRLNELKIPKKELQAQFEDLLLLVEDPQRRNNNNNYDSVAGAAVGIKR